MFGKEKSHKPAVCIDTLISQQTHIKGDIEFSSGLRVNGTIIGKINDINSERSRHGYR
jgi:cytoskeletal protein CcmA (bactofilin family)